jgi:hypothetical protein
MKYTVTWTAIAEAHLAALWVNGPNRDAITAAANAIDAALARDPLAQGESRYGTTRFLFVPPLAVFFDVSPMDRLVFVRDVWRPVKA